MNQTSENLIGISKPEVWDELGIALQGEKMLEKPRVSKKVLVKSQQMQVSAMKNISIEFGRMNLVLEKLLRDMDQANTVIRKTQEKSTELQLALSVSNDKIEILEEKVAVQGNKINQLERLKQDVKNMKDSTSQLEAKVKASTEQQIELSIKMEKSVASLQCSVHDTDVFCHSLETRMNNEQKDLRISSSQVLVDSMNLSEKLEIYDIENKAREDSMLKSQTKLLKQSNNLQEMMFESRKTLEENNNRVENVQRELLNKADREKVNSEIERKYEEIILHLQKSLASINEDEDEFKRISKDLQKVVQMLSTSKADKKDLLEVKEQVLYDSRVRQQVESLRLFVDQKINRDEVEDEIRRLITKSEVEEMIKRMMIALKTDFKKDLQTSASLDGSCLLLQGSSRKARALPRLEKSRVGQSGKNSEPVAFGGGFNLKNSDYPSSSPVISTKQKKVGAKQHSGPETANATTRVLLGVDGQVYHGEVGEETQANATADERLDS